MLLLYNDFSVTQHLQKCPFLLGQGLSPCFFSFLHLWALGSCILEPRFNSTMQS